MTALMQKIKVYDILQGRKIERELLVSCATGKIQELSARVVDSRHGEPEFPLKGKGWNVRLA